MIKREVLIMNEQERLQLLSEGRLRLLKQRHCKAITGNKP